ncbi:MULTISPECIES: NUMOD4 motif-containing HNH endonuclease [unclassified Rhodococcus (in: high G+C Gram-positive bacteria)]|uniref:NUMOD4 motif-containing HNH endonuclease n=1 Tax=unclassified Rhodococcus (in: high G+C Gram-positive bacteria) TaxID=192944 RepID=UPI0011408B6F
MDSIPQDSSQEFWKPVVGVDGYEVSSLGRVRSKPRTVRCSGSKTPPHNRRYSGRILRPSSLPKGYQLVALGSKDHGYVHILVAEAFIGPCPVGLEVAHNDGDPRNNSLTNLRYATPGENNRDKRAHGTDHNVNKSHCPRGHKLEMPNLVPHKWERGWRCCRACSQAAAVKQRRPHTDFDAEADRRYALIGVAQ